MLLLVVVAKVVIVVVVVGEETSRARGRVFECHIGASVYCVPLQRMTLAPVNVSVDHDVSSENPVKSFFFCLGSWTWTGTYALFQTLTFAGSAWWVDLNKYFILLNFRFPLKYFGQKQKTVRELKKRRISVLLFFCIKQKLR